MRISRTLRTVSILFIIMGAGIGFITFFSFYFAFFVAGPSTKLIPIVLSVPFATALPIVTGYYLQQYRLWAMWLGVAQGTFLLLWGGYFLLMSDLGDGVTGIFLGLFVLTVLLKEILALRKRQVEGENTIYRSE